MTDDLDKDGRSSEGENGGGDVLQDSSRPAVASAPKKMAFILGFAALFIAIVVRSLFFGDEPPKIEAKKAGSNHIAPPTATAPAELIPQLPPPVTVQPVQLPPVNINPPVFATPQLKTSDFSDDELKRRTHSPMVVNGGGLLSGLKADSQNDSTFIGNDRNSEWARSVEKTRVEQAIATRVDNLNYKLVQGKIIEGVLETAINTDLPGMVRAIVSHDTYAEAGKNILIPKGSRIVGQYNSSIIHGQARVFIIWTRVIRPDGIDIMIDSPGIDSLGRAGSGGYVDNHYFEMFSTAIFTSSLDIGVAAIGDALFGNQQQTTTSSTSGATTTTASPTSTAMQTAVQNLGSVGASIVNSNLNLAPTITVDQGTPINIFVNKDLEFPPQILSNTSFVQ